MFALVARIESRSYSISDRMARCYQPREPHAREAAPVLAIRARASRDDVSRVAPWSRRVARCSVRCILDVVSTNGDMHAVSARCRQSAMPSMRCAAARNRARRTRDDARSPSRCGCEKITQSTLLTLVGKRIRVRISPTTGAMCSVRCKQMVAAKKPAAKKPAAKRAAAKPAAKKPAAKRTAVKPAAKRTAAKPAAKRTAAKPAAKRAAKKA